MFYESWPFNWYLLLNGALMLLVIAEFVRYKPKTNKDDQTSQQ